VSLTPHYPQDFRPGEKIYSKTVPAAHARLAQSDYTDEFSYQPPHEKTAAAALEVHDYEGTTGDPSHITRSERGMIPVSEISNMRGARGERPGEHRNRQGEKWEDFKRDIAANGITNPVFITVDHGQDPELSEGNHRRDAALELGLTHVPAEIRYYGHAERQGTVSERAGRRTAVSYGRGRAHWKQPPETRTGQPGEHMYRVQMPEYHERTLAHGIPARPSAGMLPDDPEKAVYLTATDRVYHVRPEHGHPGTDAWRREMADHHMYKIDVSGLPLTEDRTYTNPKTGEKPAWMATQDIGPERISAHEPGSEHGVSFSDGTSWEPGQKTAVITPGSLPGQQQAAFDTEDDREHRRKMFEVAKHPEPGTRVWRGEVRRNDEHPETAESTGMHWSASPDPIITGWAPEGHKHVVWQGVIEHHDEQAFPRSHPIWRGRHMSFEHEAEVRFRPGARVKLEGAYVHEPREYPGGLATTPGYLVPRIPERTHPDWKWHPLDRHITIRHSGQGAADYSDVGIERESAAMVP
jgi:hypothetical protein